MFLTLILHLLACLLPYRQAPPQTNPHLDWLRSHTVPVATVASDASGFEDLQPFKKAIGDARMVLLGELTHGDGTGFEAKVRREPTPDTGSISR